MAAPYTGVSGEEPPMDAHNCPVCPGCNQPSHTCPACGLTLYHFGVGIAPARLDPPNTAYAVTTGPAGPEGWFAKEIARLAAEQPLDQALAAHLFAQQGSMPLRSEAGTWQPWQPQPAPDDGGGPLLYETNVYEELLDGWRRRADQLREAAGTIPPSDAATAGRYNAHALGLDEAANGLSDVIEPLRTKEATPHAH